MAWGENAVIVKEEGNRIFYYPKCPYCGKVHSHSNFQTNVAPGGTSGTINTHCLSCGRIYNFMIHRN